MLQSFEQVVAEFPVLNASEPVIMVETQYAVHIEEFSSNSFMGRSLSVAYSFSEGIRVSSDIMPDTVAVIDLPASLLSSEIGSASECGSLPAQDSQHLENTWYTIL